MNFPKEINPSVHPIIMLETATRRCGIQTHDIKSGGKEERLILAKACMAYIYFEIEGFDQVQTSIMVGWRSASSVGKMMNKIDSGGLDAVAHKINANASTFIEFAKLAYASAVEQTNNLPAHRWPPTRQSIMNKKACFRHSTAPLRKVE